jgi:hypothetical protein
MPVQNSRKRAAPRRPEDLAQSTAASAAGSAAAAPEQDQNTPRSPNQPASEQALKRAHKKSKTKKGDLRTVLIGSRDAAKHHKHACSFSPQRVTWVSNSSKLAFPSPNPNRSVTLLAKDLAELGFVGSGIFHYREQWKKNPDEKVDYFFLFLTPEEADSLGAFEFSSSSLREYCQTAMDRGHRKLGDLDKKLLRFFVCLAGPNAHVHEKLQVTLSEAQRLCKLV